MWSKLLLRLGERDRFVRPGSCRGKRHPCQLISTDRAVDELGRRNDCFVFLFLLLSLHIFYTVQYMDSWPVAFCFAIIHAVTDGRADPSTPGCRY
jgi:hypothetical protein